MLINDVVGMLWRTFIDWSGLLANPRIARSRDTISWHGYSATFLPSQPSAADISGLAETGQYTFQVVEDGGMLQFYYAFGSNGNVVTAASLGYFGVRSSVASEMESQPEPDAGELEGEPVPLSDELELERPVWLRLDFAPDDEGGVLHSACHLHLNGFEQGRVVVKGLPSPAQFTEFVFLLAYPHLFKAHRLDAAGNYHDESTVRKWNLPLLKMDDGKTEALCTHLRIAGA